MVRRQSANDPCHRRNEGVRIARGAHEQPAHETLLQERLIDRHRRRPHDVLVVQVGHDADDAARLGFAERRTVPPQLSIEGVAVGEQTLRDALADDDDGRGAGAVVSREIAAGNHWNPEHPEEARPDEPQPPVRVLFSVGRRVALDGEPEAGPRAGVAPGHDAA